MTDLAKTTIRSLKAEDREEWQKLWAAYNAFYDREGDTALPERVIQTSWERLLNDAENVHGLVADVDGALVGLTHFIFHRNLIQETDTCYMQDLFTSPEARGQGVGRLLIDAIKQACRDRGVSDIYWHTHGSNETARSLYDRIACNTDFLVYRLDVD